MLIKYFQWNSILLLFLSLYLIQLVNGNRENLAQRHPCYTVNKLLLPYIKWTEKLASTQYKAQTDACGQTKSGPACCTNEIFNSYAYSLSSDLKLLFDDKLNELANGLSLANKQTDLWIKEYIREFRHITVSALENLFGSIEYRENIHHSLVSLFKNLSDQHSNDNDVSKSAVNLFNQLILSAYRRFMTNEQGLALEDNFIKCIINKASEIEALPKKTELLYTLTSAKSLIKILRTLFIYIDADIQRFKETVTLDSQQCLQRYVRETLCPICVSTLSSSVSYDNNVNEPLCENDCHFVIKTCLNETSNPYIAFALIAQNYSNIIQQMQESVIELKIIDRLSKLHIYLYDMVVNATNNRNTYDQLQKTCPNSNMKSFEPIISLAAITSERREQVKKWNMSLHFMLDNLKVSIGNLNKTLTQQVTNNICSNPHYAVKSTRCIQIDQHAPGSAMQWQLPPVDSTSETLLNQTLASTVNQLNELNKKMTPIHNMIVSLRPRKKFSVLDYVDDLQISNEEDSPDQIDSDTPLSSNEIIDSSNQGSLSETLYNEFDGASTRRSQTSTMDNFDENDDNHSQLLTYNITSYLFVFLILIIHRISCTYY